MTAKLTCSDCRWWHFHSSPEGEERDSDNAVGYCRRYPPERRENGVGAWPITLAYDWCGEYVHHADVSYQVNEDQKTIS
jgi:hypothetical protein